MILTSTHTRIESYSIIAYKGIVQGETWDELLLNAKEIGANAVLNTCFDDALGVDTLFHGTAAVVRRKHSPRWPRLRPKRSKMPQLVEDYS
ncbi:MAG: hypothetical protein ACRD11_01285 [Terriglobia bacterium]